MTPLCLYFEVLHCVYGSLTTVVSVFLAHSRAALVLIADWVFCNLSAARKEQTKAAMAALRALRVRVKDVSHTHSHTPCAGLLCLSACVLLLIFVFPLLSLVSSE